MPVSDGQKNLALLQQNRYLTGRLYGLVTFDYAGTIITFPAEFAVSSVPIEWMEVIFSGKLAEGGPGEDVTDQVHGSVSADGTWLVSLLYSRQVIRATTNTRTFYRIMLRNMPIVKLVGGVTTELGTFEEEGSDVQRYVDRIEYVDEPLRGSGTVTTYLSTEWKNTVKGQMPTLKLAFEKVASQKLAPLPAERPRMGMGQP